jgi:hypothetical protein
MSAPTTAKQQAKILNAHHMKTCAGFYGHGGRYFQARAVGDKLEVSPDFGEHWKEITAPFFRDHNGREIILTTASKKGRG